MGRKPRVIGDQSVAPGGSPNLLVGSDRFTPMARQRWNPDESSWSDPSQVFTDTQRVDLFNDPRWESSSHSSSRRSVALKTRDHSDRTTGKASAFWRHLVKRGAHSRD